MCVFSPDVLLMAFKFYIPSFFVIFFLPSVTQQLSGTKQLHSIRYSLIQKYGSGSGQLRPHTAIALTSAGAAWVWYQRKNDRRRKFWYLIVNKTFTLLENAGIFVSICACATMSFIEGEVCTTICFQLRRRQRWSKWRRGWGLSVAISKFLFYAVTFFVLQKYIINCDTITLFISSVYWLCSTLD